MVILIPFREFQVVDLQVFAAPRITLKPLVPTFPCFATIYVSLMEKPHVDFGLKLFGADAMSIPGLYSFVQELIKDQVANMYLWPKALEVQIMDPAKAMRKPVGIVCVKILRATKLKKKDLIGSSDPYVKLKLSEEKLSSKKTTVKHRNLNPEWNEEFNLVVKDPESQALELQLYDWEKVLVLGCIILDYLLSAVGNHEKMGMNIIPLKNLAPDETKVMTVDLLKNMDPNDTRNEKSRGQLHVELLYKPFKDDEMPEDEDPTSVEKAPEGTPAGGGLLVIIIHEAQDVEGKYHTNPSVRILYRGEEKKTKENLGYVVINLSDVVSNKRINEKYHLIDSRNGRIQIELQWRTSS
ncbi:hypothetical protein Patl1_09522 [Pistacia atlantica]|uniref:Uncharacterized protein n=1 Tax=Pistacia atlantica TaxID=434234 RepID=A0ACC1AKD0_9ROSI|nr:hypothetical protein Patl1_09522 [Pistacia atlantica]